MGGSDKIIFPEYLVAFDGNCLMCNKVAVYIHDLDKSGEIKFITLADLPESFIAQNNLQNIDSVLFIEKGVPSIKTDAAIKIGKHLGGLYKGLALIGGGIHKVVSLNGIYDFVARNRLKWFGRVETCSYIPEMQKRFITLL